MFHTSFVNSQEFDSVKRHMWFNKAMYFQCIWIWKIGSEQIDSIKRLILLSEILISGFYCLMLLILLKLVFHSELIISASIRKHARKKKHIRNVLTINGYSNNDFSTLDQCFLRLSTVLFWDRRFWRRDRRFEHWLDLYFYINAGSPIFCRLHHE